MALDFEQSIAPIEDRITELSRLSAGGNVSFDSEIGELRKKLDAGLQKIYANLTAWQTVLVARHKDRPTIRDYLANVFTEFIELHGDRCFGDDQAMVGGFATIGDRKVMVIGHQKGKTVEENIKANFGMASPDGYRKALRLMKLAEKYGIPVITFIDTPGAYPGMDAEARGQAEAIALNLAEMSVLEVPIVVVVSGEGGSGGALGIGVGDVILMLSYSVYSVISPEGCASILWRDGAKAPEAAEALKITSASLKRLGIVDEIIPEPRGGAHRHPAETYAAVRQAILNQLADLSKQATSRLLKRRFDKFDNIGRFKKTP